MEKEQRSRLQKATQDARRLLEEEFSRQLLETYVGLPWFRGQVDRSHAMTLRLSIDDQPNQDKAPVHGAAKAGGRRALPQ